MNPNDIKFAKDQWDQFVSGLSQDEKDAMDNYIEPARALDLFGLFESKQYDEFDLVINGISPQYKFDEKLIGMVVGCYQERGMSDKAFAYIVDAEKYHADTKTTGLTTDFTTLKKKFSDQKLFDSVKQAFTNILGFDADDVPPVIPAKHNRMDDLHGFIRLELIEALKQMMKRIVAIESIDFENKYNDLLIAVLKLRLPIFGLEITDQGRSGKSPHGKDAGETDFTITSGGKDKALVEAFIWKKFSLAVIKGHILKCQKYIPYTTHYYSLVYYKAKKKNFAAACEKYKEAVLKQVKYPVTWKLDKTQGFQDLTAALGHAGEIFVGKTQHGVSTLTHIMINIGSD